MESPDTLIVVHYIVAIVEWGFASYICTDYDKLFVVICTDIKVHFDCSELKSWLPRWSFVYVYILCGWRKENKHIHTWFLWRAPGYAPVPIAITLADSCGPIPIQNKTIITDVVCPRSCNGPIIADHTTRNGWAVHKSSVCTTCSIQCFILINKICFIASCIQQLKILSVMLHCALSMATSNPTYHSS